MMNTKAKWRLAAAAVASALALLPAAVCGQVNQMIVLSSVTYSATPDGCKASGVTMNSADEVIVAGTVLGLSSNSFVTVRYSRNLASPQLRAFPIDAGESRAVIAGSLDNIFVAGEITVGGNKQCLLLKYDANFQSVIASTTYDSGGQFSVMGIAHDGMDRIFVTGYTFNGADYDHHTVRFDRDLHLEATDAADAYNNDSGTYDRAYGIAVDGEGNIIIAGEQESIDRGRKYFYTVKYDPSLQHRLAWARYSGGISAVATAVAVDHQNNIIVAGRQTSDGINWRYCTVKYDSSLNQVAAVVSDSGRDETPARVAVDTDNCIIVTGKQYDGVTNNYYTVKYDRDLRQVAAYTYDGGSLDQATGLAIDSQDNIIVTGTSSDGVVNNIYTLKCNGSPRITGITSACQGATGLVSITGRNFVDGTAVSFSHPGIMLESLSVIPQNQINATITVSSGVPIGVTTVTVSNINGEAFTCGDLFEVLYRTVIVPSAETDARALLDCGSVRLVLPAWTFLDASTVTVAAPGGTLPNTGSLKPTGLSVRLEGPAGLQAQQDITLSFYYSEEIAQAVNEGRLAVAYYDAAALRWVDLRSSISPEANLVSAVTRDINRRFALVELPPPVADLAHVRVYPNPYKPGSGGDFDSPPRGEGIIFSNLVPEFSLKIFTIAGDLVFSKALTADVYNSYLWDTRSDGGEKAASGVYLYVIENGSNSAQRAKGKFSIIR